MTVLTRLKQFWHAPTLNKLQTLSVLSCRLKGILVYHFMFKEFGRGSYIRKPLLILNPGSISIGDRVSIRDGVRLEVVRTSATRFPSLSIGNDTNIEQNVHIVCHNRIRIGNGVSVTGHCAIVDVTHSYLDVDDPIKVGARVPDNDSFVEIGDGCFIGFGVVILPNVKIGTRSVIGANSVVTSNVPDYSVAAGAPARVLERYDFETHEWVKTREYTAARTEGS
jgi:acetyltransferase-like isoleucine patch superfamily enzyme